MENNNMGNYLAKNIGYLRKVKGLTQTGLSKIIDIKPAMISNYEIGRNEPSIDTIIKISDYFNVPIDLLIKTNIKKISLNSAISHIYSKKQLELWTKYKQTLETLKRPSKSHDLCLEIIKDLEQLNY